VDSGLKAADGAGPERGRYAVADREEDLRADVWYVGGRAMSGGGVCCACKHCRTGLLRERCRDSVLAM